MKRIAIITGANKGIGYHIVRSMAKSTTPLHLILACRKLPDAERAADKLKQEFAHQSFEVARVDLADGASIQSFAARMGEIHEKIDIVVHNAAIAFEFGQGGETPYKQQVVQTLAVNYFGTFALHKALLPLLKKSDRPNVVFMTSGLGRTAFNGCGKALQNRWKQVKTQEEATVLVNEFISAATSNKHKQLGWPSSPYGVSKLAVIAVCKAEAQLHPGVLINCVGPGWCRTDMGSSAAPRSAEKGAETPSVLALSATTSGDYWYDLEKVNFL